MGGYNISVNGGYINYSDYCSGENLVEELILNDTLDDKIESVQIRISGYQEWTFYKSNASHYIEILRNNSIIFKKCRKDVVYYVTVVTNSIFHMILDQESMFLSEDKDLSNRFLRHYSDAQDLH